MIDGEAVPAGAWQRLEVHLAACIPCREVRARGERLAAGLRAALEPAAGDRERWVALAAQAARTPAPAAVPRSRWLGPAGQGGFVWPLAGLAAAAAALVWMAPWNPGDGDVPALRPLPAVDDLRFYVELEAQERVPLPAIDGSPLWRDERRWARFRLPAEGFAPAGEPLEAPESTLKGLEKVDTRYIHMASWPYQ